MIVNLKGKKQTEYSIGDKLVIKKIVLDEEGIELFLENE